MHISQFINELIVWGACDEAIEWIEDSEFKTDQEMWDNIQAPGWMMWYIDEKITMDNLDASYIANRLRTKRLAIIRFLLRHVDDIENMDEAKNQVNYEQQCNDDPAGWVSEIHYLIAAAMGADQTRMPYDKIVDKRMADHLREIFPRIP